MNSAELGQLHIYTGNGKGKTSAAIGQGIRAIGAGLKVVMFCFLKNPSSEITALARLEPDFKVILANQKSRRFYWELSLEERAEVYNDCQIAWNRIQAIVTDRACDVLILDEIMAVLKHDILSLHEVQALIDKSRERFIELIITGRNAPAEILAAAGLVTEMKEVKHPLSQGIVAREGIEY